MSQTELLEQLAAQNQVFFPEKPVFEQKIWYTKLKAALGSEALVLTRAVFGTQATLTELESVGPLVSRLNARRIEHRNLMPLLAPFVRLGAVPQNFAQVRAYYELSAAAWKMLTRMGLPTIERVAPFLKQQHCKRWVELVAKSNLSNPQAILDIFNQGRPAGFVHYEHFWVGRTQCGFEQGLSRLFQAFCKKLQATNSRPEQAQIFQWLEAVGTELYAEFTAQDQPLAKNCTFDSLIRSIRQRWEKDQALIDALNGIKVLPFEVAVSQPVTTRRVRWTPLTHSRALIEEGIMMKHCVGNASYVKSCQMGHSFIFRGELIDNPLGIRVTAEFHREGQAYRCVQIKGRGNSSVAGTWIEDTKELACQLHGLTPAVVELGQVQT